MDVDRPAASSPRPNVPWPAVMLTAYMSGAPNGRNLGTCGYSYDFVVRAFAPLLKRWGELVEVPRPERRLEAEIQRARGRGLEPVHISFHALQHVCLSRRAANVVVPAWEFPDVPDHEFDNDARNNWVQTANQCSLVIVGGPFTRDVLSRAGVQTPIRVVPVPNPQQYFEVSSWQPGQRRVLECPAYVLPQAGSPRPDTIRLHPQQGIEDLPRGPYPPKKRSPAASGGLKLRMKAAVWDTYKRYIRPCMPTRFDHTLSAAARAGYTAWRTPYPTYTKSPRVELSGVVYTSIFAPADGRKNWEDLISAFLLALRDQEDATLVLKLISRDPAARNAVLFHYKRLDLHHRCKLVVITDFLPEEQMFALAEATTYYINATRAEGNCLPLMNYLAAGRPGVTPVHTAIGDYFNRDLGFAVQSHPEPAAWPQDLRHRCRTTWHRLVWPSLVDQIRASYEIAKSDRSAYQRLAAGAREKMAQWASTETVWPRLRAALQEVTAAKSLAAGDEKVAEKIAA